VVLPGLRLLFGIDKIHMVFQKISRKRVADPPPGDAVGYLTVILLINHLEAVRVDSLIAGA